jgi:hypothetical protein
MPPTEIQKLQKEVTELRKTLDEIIRNDRYLFVRDIELGNQVAIRGGGTVGSFIGKTTDDKLGFWGTTPVNQPETVATVTETGADTDGDARNRINSIISRLQEVGIIK